MVKHVVMFKLKNRTPETVNQLKDSLSGMEGRIETLRHLEVGEDFKHSERSCDLVLITHFDNREGLSTYSSHPVHQPVLELVRSLCSQTWVVDFELP